MKSVIVATMLSLSLLGGLSISSLAQTASTNQEAADAIVHKTLSLKNVAPAAMIRLIESASLLPKGIEGVTPSTSDYSLTVHGTAEAIAELETIISLFDVKPRIIKVETRLFEIQLSKDGTPQKTLVQSPVVTTKNNIKAQCAFSTEDESTAITVTPHANGDGSISLQIALTLSRSARSSKFTAVARLPKQQEWNTVKTISLSRDKKIQEAMQSGAEPSAAAYPLYRLDVSASMAE